MLLKNIIFFLLVITTLNAQDEPDFKCCANIAGEVFCISTEDNRIVITSSDGDDIDIFMFDHPDDATVCQPNIAIDDAGQSLAAWVEFYEQKSTCVSTYNNGLWEEPCIISENYFVDLSCPPSVKVSKDEGIVVFTATKGEDSFVLYNYYSEGNWEGVGIIYQENLGTSYFTKPAFSSDEYETHVACWIDQNNGQLLAAYFNYDIEEEDWTVNFSADANPDFAPHISTDLNGDSLLIWSKTEGVIQPAFCQNGRWSEISPFNYDGKVMALTIESLPIGGHLLLLITEEDECYFSQMALFENDSFTFLPKTEIEMEDWSDES